MHISLGYLSENNLKDTFVHLGVNLGDLPNQRRPTVDTEIIRSLNM